MTGYGLIASLAWAAVAAFFVFAMFVNGSDWIVAAYGLEDDETASIDVPDDLSAIALGETEEWAQKAVIKVIHEKYALYKDWNKVRAAMGVAQRDR